MGLGRICYVTGFVVFSTIFFLVIACLTQVFDMLALYYVVSYCRTTEHKCYVPEHITNVGYVIDAVIYVFDIYLRKDAIK